MALLDIRQRTGWLLAAVTVGHLVLISAQVTSRRGVPVLEEAVFSVFAEVQRVTTGGVGSARGVWSHYVRLQDIERDNQELRQEIAQLRIGLQRERALAQQSLALQRALDLRNATDVSTLAASVIAGGASPDFRTITIDKGTMDGLKPDMAVIAPEGVVGRIILPSARAAKVQLLIDRNAGAGALVERSRAQGVVIGTGTNQLRLEYVAEAADIRVGDVVVTSGTDGIYPAATMAGQIPKGFVIGRIESITQDGSGNRVVVVTPAVDFTGLEVVLVVSGTAPLAASPSRRTAAPPAAPPTAPPARREDAPAGPSAGDEAGTPTARVEQTGTVGAPVAGGPE